MGIYLFEISFTILVLFAFIYSICMFLRNIERRDAKYDSLRSEWTKEFQFLHKQTENHVVYANDILKQILSTAQEARDLLRMKV